MAFDTQILENAGIRLIDGDRGQNYPKQEHFKNSGYCLFLSAKNVTSNGFEFEERSFIDKERDALLRAGKLQRGDIVLTTRGTIGNVAYYGDNIPFDCIRINSGMIIVRADDTVWNRRFLYFLFASSYMQDQIAALTTGSAVPQLPARDLKKFKLPIISRDTQDAFDKVVGDFTEKSQLNRRINQTLEVMAQAIFKSWFVDFDPVKAKIAAIEQGQDPLRAAMRAISGKTDAELDQMPREHHDQLAATSALFSDAIEESELGEIPKGWAVGTLADLCHLNPESWSARTLPDIVRYVDLANAKGGEISEVQSLGGKDIPSRARRILRYGDTIVGTVRPGNRSFALIGEDGLTGSTGFAVLRPKSAPWLEFVYLVATSEANIERLAHLADGGAYPAVRPEIVVQEDVVIPTESIVQAFSQHVKPLFAKILSNRKSAVSLAELRDTLLPKLLSGEISVESLMNEVAQ